jgi:hypothetical protein
LKFRYLSATRTPGGRQYDWFAIQDSAGWEYIQSQRVGCFRLMLQGFSDQTNIARVSDEFLEALEVMGVHGTPTEDERRQAGFAAWRMATLGSTSLHSVQDYPLYLDTYAALNFTGEASDYDTDGARRFVEHCRDTAVLPGKPASAIPDLEPETIETDSVRHLGLSKVSTAVAGMSGLAAGFLGGAVGVALGAVTAVLILASLLLSRKRPATEVSWAATRDRLIEQATAKPTADLLETQVAVWEIENDNAGTADPEARAEAVARGVWTTILHPADDNATAV